MTNCNVFVWICTIGLLLLNISVICNVIYKAVIKCRAQRSANIMMQNWIVANISAIGRMRCRFFNLVQKVLAKNTDREKLEKNVLFANMIFQCVSVCLAVVLILTVQKDERLSQTTCICFHQNRLSILSTCNGDGKHLMAMKRKFDFFSKICYNKENEIRR